MRQVTPEYVRALHAAEVTDANTARGITEIRFEWCPVDVRDTARETLGYRRLSGSQLIELWQNRVTPEIIRRLQEAGYRTTPPDSLIELLRRRR